METYTVKSHDLDKIEKRIARLAKKADKLGLGNIELTVGETYAQTVKFNGLDYTVQMVDISISGEAITPKIEGWTFVAQIEHTPAGNIIRSISGDNVDEKYRTSKSTCDHCNTNRTRKNTYVIANEDGETLQVGKSCLQNYTHIKNADKIASFYTNLDFSFLTLDYTDDEDYSGGIARGEYQFSIVQFYACVLATVREDGDCYYGSSTDTPTKISAMSNFLGGEVNIENHIEDAKVAIALTLNFLDTERAKFGYIRNDYHHNLDIILTSDTMEYRHAGYVSSIYMLVKKLTEQDVTSEESKTSNHIGEIKEKVSLALTFKSENGFESQYGWVTFYNFETDDGDKIVWKTASSPKIDGETRDPIEGEKYTMTATIKAHDSYNMVKQTHVIRAKLAEIAS